MHHVSTMAKKTQPTTSRTGAQTRRASPVTSAKRPKFSPIPAHGTLLSWDEFLDDVQNGMLEDYDGHGDLATATEVSNVGISPSDLSYFMRPSWATHVCWYNR